MFGEGGVGPRGMEACTPGGEVCTSLWWSDVAVPGTIPIFTVVTLVLGLGAAAVALTCGAMALARRQGGMPHRSARVLLQVSRSRACGDSGGTPRPAGR